MSDAAPTPEPHPNPPSTSNVEPISPSSPVSRFSSLPISLDFALAAAQHSITAAPDDADASTERQAQRAQQARHLAFLEDLVRNLDILVYAQLSALYYMDCSILPLLLRLAFQWIYFTPKPLVTQHLPAPFGQPRGAILEVLCLLCLFAHVVFSAPASSEAMRGYLHGGLVIDFVGVKGPVSRLRLVVGDVVVLGLQWVLKGLMVEMARIREGVAAGVGPRVGVGVGADRPREVGDEERDLGKDNEDGADKAEEHPLDRYYGGQVVVANVRIVDAVKKAWRWRDTPG